MAVMFEDSIKRDLKTGNIAPCYLLFGDDSYLKKHYFDSIINAVCGDNTDFDLQIFEDNADLQAVFDAVNQFPMITEKKCVCLFDYDIEHAGTAELNRLTEILSDLPDTAVFILRFDSVPFDDKRSSKAKKLIEAAEKSKGKAIKLDHRSVPELVQMLIRGAKKRGVELSQKTARYLIEVAGDDINLLTGELEKLCLFASDGEISEKTVDNVCVKTVDASVYEFTKEIFNCNVTKALSYLDSMFFMRIEPMIILYTMAASYVDIYRVYSAMQFGIKQDDIAKDFSYGKKAFTLDRAKKNAAKFSGEKIILSFNELLHADKLLKSANADARVVLEKLTLKLVMIIAGEGDAP